MVLSISSIAVFPLGASPFYFWYKFFKRFVKFAMEKILQKNMIGYNNRNKHSSEDGFYV